MVSDEEVMLLFKKYLHFNSREEAEEFTSTFFGWLREYGSDLVAKGFKDGCQAMRESVVKTIRQIDKEGGCSLETLAKGFEG